MKINFIKQLDRKNLSLDILKNHQLRIDDGNKYKNISIIDIKSIEGYILQKRRYITNKKIKEILYKRKGEGVIIYIRDAFVYLIICTLKPP